MHSPTRLSAGQRTSQPDTRLHSSIPDAALHCTASDRQVEKRGVGAVVGYVAVHNILAGDEQPGVVRVCAATAATAAAGRRNTLPPYTTDRLS
jgi:hypothetical protein